VHALDEAVESNEVEKQPKADREKVNMQPDCETKRVLLDVMVLDQTVVIGSNLLADEEANLVQFLQKNKDVFAWSAKDLIGVDRSFIEHKLNIDPSVKPRKQKLRKMSDDKVVAVKSEVQRLLDATVIREVMYPKWLANTVPVKKKNGKWRMCIDFTDLNKATPKDNYPLPRMDQVVDCGQRRDHVSVRLLLWISPVLDGEGGCGKNQFHHTLWNLLLRLNARRFEKCRLNIH
jgi:hypothetical protein